MDRYRLVVVGVGGIGSAACYWGARASGGVLGLEQHALFHDAGGSQDHSRIIRLAQHSEPYATLAPSAYAAWHEVERESASQLVVETGGLVVEAVAERTGLETGTRNIDGYCRLFRAHGVPFDLLDAAQIEQRWPQLRLRGDERGVYQGSSGIVDARRATATHVALARAAGAEVRDRSPVRALRPTSRGVEVVLDDEVVLAERVVLASGAWTDEVMPEVAPALPLTVTQEQVTYYATPNLADFSPARFPVFMWHGRHNFYGFPVYGEVATKLGQHMGGPPVTARTRDFVPDPEREQRQERFLSEHVPGFLGPVLYTKTCLYTLTPDQDFVLGPVPEEPRVVVAVGAGHAFKFASLLGRVLVEMALDGGTRHPVDAFAVDRPALRDPSFSPAHHV